jgi:aspartate dehydrogenase
MAGLMARGHEPSTSSQAPDDGQERRRTVTKRVGILGFGTIGRYLYEQLSAEGVAFAFVYDKQPIADDRIADIFTNSAEELEKRCATGVDLVVETATAEAVVELAAIVLKHTDMAVFSSTAFADPAFQSQAEQLCRTYGHKLYIPHGAVLGFDGIVDGRAVLEEVTITTAKRPQNLGRTDTSRVVLFDGPTREACKMYPRNVNVHAGTALAGLGLDRTRSRIVSDPDSPGNKHTIEIKASGCEFRIEVLSRPGSGVTGAYTPISACSSVRRILSQEGIVII